MTDQEHTDSAPIQPAVDYSPRSLILATIGAAAVAVAVLVTAILPAEYGSDPLGTGAALGLTALANGENPLEEQSVELGPS